MPPRRSVATLASQPIGNVIAAALTREIKLSPFEEDMPQAWYNQAEAYFCLHSVTDRMFWFNYIDAIAEKTGKGHPISPEPAPGRI